MKKHRIVATIETNLVLLEASIDGRRVVLMAEKLGIGDAFPNLTLNLVDGTTLALPDGMDAKYRIVLFYRGHW